MESIALSLTLLMIGMYGLVTKRSLLKTLISIELIAAAASMNFATFSSVAGDRLGQAFFVLALSVDTSMTAIVIAIVLLSYRELKVSDAWELHKLRGRSKPK
ncbi:MAG: NADH-quinone oxidoreductase subunit K [Candidatus Brockarchaeota archaeon]|nr:NADH-quinone oxidoreductase subunit K [Candidatus Brockarchaeota archaeon]